MSFENNGNPIVAVGTTSNPTTTVKCPASFTYDEEDVSAADSGRTEDAIMHKNRVAIKVKLSFSWSYLTTDELYALMQIFKHEYLYIKYISPSEVTTVNGTTTHAVTKKFYLGNRQTSTYSGYLDRWTEFTVNAIEV